MYCTLTDENGDDVKWDLSQNFNHRDNQAINAAIINGVRSTDTSTPVSLIRAAMRSHFRTKKRQQKIKDAKKEKELLREQRIRSRKNTKRLKRVKALAQSSSISNEEKRDFEQFMSVDYMSSEHSVSEDNTHGEEDQSSSDEDGPKRKVLCRRPLTWRSENLTSLFSRLDHKYKKKAVTKK